MTDAASLSAVNIAGTEISTPIWTLDGNVAIYGTPNQILLTVTGDGFDTVNYVKSMQISLSGGTEIKTLGKSGSDLVLGFDKNSSVKVAKNFAGSISPKDDIYLGGKKLSVVVTIDAGAVTGKVTISGNDKLYGDDGANKIYGGSGNDSLWGDAGNDTFIYSSGDGKDVIYGFESGDLLLITGAFFASYSKSKNSVAFKVGSDSVTLKDFGTTTTFHVNNTTYKLSGGKLCTK